MKKWISIKKFRKRISFCAERKYKKLNIIIFYKQQMNLIQYTVHLEIRVSIDKYLTVKALVDSETTENYIITVYTQRKRFSII